jgi:hypothetical protein
MALACALATAQPATAQAPIRFTHVVETGRGPISIPTELYLEARNDDIIAVKVAGNLGALQAALPVLLSRVVEDTCRRRVGVEVQTVRPEGDALRLTGRVQIISYRCRGDNLDSRLRIFSNVTGFDALVDGRLEDNCLGAELEELSVDPSGLVGGLINLLGLRDRIASKAREAINEGLEGSTRCIDLPDKLQILETHLSTGGFRDFGDGAMGFVVEGTINVRARNLVTLLGVLAKEGDFRN